MRTSIKNFRLNPKSFSIALLVLSVICFVPFIHRLGFYWDDWPSIWFLHFWGPSSFKEGFSVDRPLLAWVFMLTTTLLGESTLGWQLFGVFSRLLISLTLFWTLHGLWPKQTARVAWITILFTVYPGFGQQFISVTYGNAFLVYSCFLFSLGTMIWAFRKPRWYWPLMVLSWLTAAFSLFTSEYFFGLELFRLVILWLIMNNKDLPPWKRVRQVLITWIHYAIIVVAFLIWRIFLYQSPRATITIFNQLRLNPFSAIIILVKTILIDFFEAAVLPWVRSFNLLPVLNFDTVIILTYIGIVIGVIGLSYLFISLLRDPKETDGTQESEEPASSKKWAIEAILVGLLALAFAGWPIWVTDLHIELIFPWDRFTLAMMPGACILLVGVVDLIAKARWQASLFLAVVAGFSAGMQFQYRLAYRQDWITQKAFFWQLIERAPGIKPGTLILTNELPFQYYSDNSLSAPLNWIYSPQQTSRKMSYLFYDIEARLGKGLPSLETNLPIHEPYRATSFDGNTSQALVLFYDPPRCLKVVDPVLDTFLPYKPNHIPEALALSQPDLIQVDANPGARPPSSIFGLEPQDWCYYFEKAELARQKGDWQEVANLGDKGIPLKKKFTKETATELLTFIEGYAHTGQWDKAVQLSARFLQATEKANNIVCQTWDRIDQNTSPTEDRKTAFLQIKSLANCQFP